MKFTSRFLLLALALGPLAPAAVPDPSAIAEAVRQDSEPRRFLGDLIEDSSAIIVFLVATVTNVPALGPTRFAPAEIRESFERYKLLPRLQRSGLELPQELNPSSR